MACGDDLPDITDLPVPPAPAAAGRGESQAPRAQGRGEEEAAGEVPGQEAAALSAVQQQPQHEREHQESSADQATAGPPTQPAVRGEEPTATTAMHAEQIRGADAEMARLQAQVQSLELEFEGL
eukprot:CAMPEP_0179297004 /NCGR_PEP_ID=MMETSP0797-20121207/45235_1 /TAXON_ID=47934 /ORGANISM="Dinophysis acuminata, Strain DAEP01" /LENGTH=123 /DNA_ID=CAMNT_0021006309 /DNA_START=56 /DNA_END=424 /DNA_ORIENTATION=+